MFLKTTLKRLDLGLDFGGQSGEKSRNNRFENQCVFRRRFLRNLKWIWDGFWEGLGSLVGNFSLFFFVFSIFSGLVAAVVVAVVVVVVVVRISF